MKFKKGCNRTCLVQAALEMGDRHLGKHIRVGEEGRGVSQIMALGMRDEVTRLRISKNSSTIETAKLQTRLDCCLDKLGKFSSSTALLFSS